MDPMPIHYEEIYVGLLENYIIQHRSAIATAGLDVGFGTGGHVDFVCLLYSILLAKRTNHSTSGLASS